MVELLLCKQVVAGSIPVASTGCTAGDGPAEAWHAEWPCTTDEKEGCEGSVPDRRSASVTHRALRYTGSPARWHPPAAMAPEIAIFDNFGNVVTTKTET